MDEKEETNDDPSQKGTEDPVGTEGPANPEANPEGPIELKPRKKREKAKPRLEINFDRRTLNKGRPKGKPNKDRSADAMFDLRTLFVEEYLRNFDSCAAYKSLGYQPQTNNGLRVGASSFLHHPETQKILNQRRKEIREELALETSDLIRQLSMIAVMDMRGFYREDGSLKPISELTDNQGAVLAAIESVEDQFGARNKKVKVWPKLEAIKMLFQRLGEIKTVIELSGPNGSPLQIQSEHKLDTEAFKSFISDIVSTGGTGEIVDDLPGDGSQESMDQKSSAS